MDKFEVAMEDPRQDDELIIRELVESYWKTQDAFLLNQMNKDILSILELYATDTQLGEYTEYYPSLETWGPEGGDPQTYVIYIPVIDQNYVYERILRRDLDYNKLVKHIEAIKDVCKVQDEQDDRIFSSTDMHEAMYIGMQAALVAGLEGVKSIDGLTIEDFIKNYISQLEGS